MYLLDLLYRSIHTSHMCEAWNNNLVHTSPGNCIPIFNSSTSVKHFFSPDLVQSEINVTFSSNINATPFGQKLFKYCLSASQELKIGMKNVYFFNKLNSHAGALHFVHDHFFRIKVFRYKKIFIFYYFFLMLCT